MPYILQTISGKIESVPNIVNRALISQFYDYMKERDLSTNHQINNLKVVISFANHLGNTSFQDLTQKDQILYFLDSNKKEADQDPDRKWITTWNYYLNRLKLFFRWLHNRGTGECSEIDTSDWKKPEFVQINQPQDDEKILPMSLTNAASINALLEKGLSKLKE